MSVKDTTEVLARAREDPTFRELLETEPDRALHGYDIEPWERAAIISGDTARLEELGVRDELSELAPDFNPVRQEPTEP
ncbi:MAG TPA: hypothetical protein VF221_17270 [Chloroflexota bacterium]